MAKFVGNVGFVSIKETSDMVYDEDAIEKRYRGDVLRNTRKWEQGTGLNDDLNVNNIISIVGNSFAFENVSYIRYVKWMGAKWKVTNVEIKIPRLLLTIGGVYNG